MMTSATRHDEYTGESAQWLYLAFERRPSPRACRIRRGANTGCRAWPGVASTDRRSFEAFGPERTRQAASTTQ